MITILVLATEWASRHGGLSSFNRALCRALAAQGCSVFCNLPRPAAADDEADARQQGVSLISPDFRGELPERELLCLPPALPSQCTPDWIVGHGHVTGPAALVLQRTTFRETRRAHVVHVAPGLSEWFKKPPDGASAAQKAEQREQLELSLARDADLVVAVGPLLFREISTLLPHRASILQVVPGLNPADGPLLSPPPGQQCLVIARAEDFYLKGLDIAARAVKEARAPEGRSPTLVVRGALPHEADLVRCKLQEAAGHGIDARVREYTADANRVIQDLGRATVLLMPSRAEGFGLAALEAIAQGVPVLISDQSGLAETLRAEFGEAAHDMVVPVVDHEPDDSAAWSFALRGILENPTRAFENARAARERLHTVCDWGDVAGLLLARMDPSGSVQQVPTDTREEIVHHHRQVRAPALLWSTPVGIGTLKTMPVVADGNVYVPTAGLRWNVPDPRDGVCCLDLATGREVWHCATGTDANALLLDGERILVGTDGGELIAIDRNGGTLRWRADLSTAVLAKPIVADRRVIAATSGGSLFTLDLRDGQILSRLTADGPIVADPMILNNMLYAFTKTGAIHRVPLDSLSFHKDGLLPVAARVAYPTRFALSAVAPCEFTGSPVAVGALLLCPYARYTYFEGVPMCGLSVEDLKPVWIAAHDPADPERQYGNVRATPAVCGELAVVPVSYGNDVVACTMEGVLAWSSACGVPFFPQYGSPAALGSLVLVPRYDGYLHCLHSRTGDRLWSICLGSEADAGVVRGQDWTVLQDQDAEWENPMGPLNSPAAVHENVALVLVSDGRLCAVEVGETV